MMEGAVKKKKTFSPGRAFNKFRATGFYHYFCHDGGIDVIFCCIVMILFAFGLVMMYSAGYAYSNAYRNSANELFLNQLKYGLLGFVLMFVVSRIDYRILNSIFTPIVFLLTVGLLFLTLLLNIHNDIKRWINLGPISFQPSEIAKFVLILTMSYTICILYNSIHAPKGKHIYPRSGAMRKFEKVIFGFASGPFSSAIYLAAIVCCFCLLIMLESHLSCTILLFLIGVSMMWAGGVKKKYFAILFAVMAVVLVYVVFINPEVVKMISNYGYERIMVWKTKATYGSTTYWQTQHGLYAIASGGPFGVGFGNSRQKQLYIPEPQNDFIFSIICEELGFVGAIIVIILFAVLICRGFVIATKSHDLFGSLLVIGIMLQVGLQVLINIAVVTDLIPNTGIALPFFSYGGTALVILQCEMGVVLSVSRRSKIEKS